MIKVLVIEIINSKPRQANVLKELELKFIPTDRVIIGEFCYQVTNSFVTENGDVTLHVKKIGTLQEAENRILAQ